jgi:acetoin utilization deacetylase AcuC-like enzyme
MSPVWLFSDPRMLDHRTPPDHPERPERLAAVLQAWKRWGFPFTCPSGKVREAADSELERVHTASYLTRLHKDVTGHAGKIESDTWVSAGSELAARLAAGAVLEAVDAVLLGKTRRAFCAVRPPGHHARSGSAMGFCLYGNVALAAAHALDARALNRVLVVDFDVHHGNGTQEMFYQDPRVGFLSIHRWPFYPGTGAREETGAGAGLGTTLNLPIAFGTSRAQILSRFRAELESFADRIRPELVLLSAGFDAHALDPVGNLGLEIEDFTTLTRAVLDIAETHASGRLVSVLEGGYNIPILAECVVAHLEAMGAEIDIAH